MRQKYSDTPRIFPKTEGQTLKREEDARIGFREVGLKNTEENAKKEGKVF